MYFLRAVPMLAPSTGARENISDLGSNNHFPVLFVHQAIFNLDESVLSVSAELTCSLKRRLGMMVMGPNKITSETFRYVWWMEHIRRAS